MTTTLYKAIITGNLHELFIYEKPIEYGFKFTPEQILAKKRRAFSNALDMTPEEIQERQKLYLKCSSDRAKIKIKRLVQGNMYRFGQTPKFLTLTFNREIVDLKIANREFTNFIKRFDRYLGYKVRYVAVPEYQKDIDYQGNIKENGGNVHYHMILFNSDFIAEKYIAEKIWKNGSVEIQKVYKSKGLCTYMTKYISKSFEDIRYKGHKRYFFSLEEHTITEKQHEVAKKILDSMNSKDLVYSYQYNLYNWKIKDEEQRYKEPINKVIRFEYMVFGGSGGVASPF